MKDVRKELSSLNKKNWMKLGEELGIDEDIMETVSADPNRDGVEECLSEMHAQALVEDELQTTNVQLQTTNVEQPCQCHTTNW